MMGITTFGLVMALQVSASLENIVYPVAQLGNCASQEECFAYCNEPANYDVCIAFADENDLLAEEEIQEYQQMQDALEQGGPGGCSSEDECEAYCSDVAHMQECISFAQEQGLMSSEELEEAQQVLAALEAGYSLPGGCSSEETCEAYCSDVVHMQECLTFAQAAGFMTQEEAQEAAQMIELMQSGSTPGGCTSEDECRSYCEDESHMDECLNFAVEAGVLTQEEVEQIKAMGMEPMESFVGPGGCDSEESCKTYCSDKLNREECESFFGSMGENEYDEDSEHENENEMKSFVGPGGCTNETECMAYCSDPAHRQECETFFGSSDHEANNDSYNDSQYQQEESITPESSNEDEYDSEEFEDEEFQYEDEYSEEHKDDSQEYDYQYDYEQAQEYDEYYLQEEIHLDEQSLNLEEYDEQPTDKSYDEIYVEPEYTGETENHSEGSSENSGGDSSQEGEPQSLSSEIDAGFVESVKKFLARFLLQTN